MPNTIIIVENSNAVRELIGFTLERDGYKVIKAEDGFDALKKMNMSAVDMIFTDIHMPNMDGIEFIRHVRANPKYRFVPIIIVTTDSNESLKEKARTAGVTAWIIKPFKKDQLLRVVKRVLG
ncbi:MAG: response regulator [Desulfobacterales bacterium]|nr:response regulator [Desulfobacterales bacterium]